MGVSFSDLSLIAVFCYKCFFFCLQPHPGAVLGRSHQMGGFPPGLSLRRLARAVRNLWSYEEHAEQEALQ